MLMVLLAISCSKDPYQKALNKSDRNWKNKSRYLHEAIAIDSTKYDAYFLLGLININTNSDSSILYLEKAREKDSTIANLWYLLGKAYYDKSGVSHITVVYDSITNSQIKLSLTMISHAIKLDSTNGSYYYERARIINNRFGRTKETMDNLQKACKYSHKNSVPCMVYYTEKLAYDSIK